MFRCIIPCQITTVQITCLIISNFDFGEQNSGDISHLPNRYCIHLAAKIRVFIYIDLLVLLFIKCFETVWKQLKIRHRLIVFHFIEWLETVEN